MKQRREVQRGGIKDEKLRGLLPTQRQKKRFIRFHIDAEQPFSYDTFTKPFLRQLEAYLGIIDMSLYGVWLLKDQFDENRQEAILRVSVSGQKKTCSALSLIEELQGTPLRLDIKKISGTLKGAWSAPRRDHHS